MNMWIIFAILSAVFAALTSILAKVGIEGVDSNLATAVRTIVVVIRAWAMVFITNTQSGLSQISRTHQMIEPHSKQPNHWKDYPISYAR